MHNILAPTLTYMYSHPHLHSTNTHALDDNAQVLSLVISTLLQWITGIFSAHTGTVVTVYKYSIIMLIIIFIKRLSAQQGQRDMGEMG